MSFPRAISQHVRLGLPVGFSDFRSSPGEFLTVWGVQLLAVALFAACGLAALIRRAAPPHRLLWWGAVGALWLMLFLVTRTTVAASLALLAIATAAAWAGSSRRPEYSFASALTFAALAILLGCEFVYVRDGYGHGLQRMNTIFKFHYACWIVLGVCLPFHLRHALRARSIPAAWRWTLAAAVLALAAWTLEYPLLTTRARLAQYRAPGWSPEHLDGMRYMQREHPGDYAAIQWLRRNTRSGQVVLEAVGGGYTYHARVATHTPLRAVLGWPGHEHTWRGEHPGDIERDIRAIYRAPTVGQAMPLLRKYGVDYIYIGELERSEYPSAALRKFGERFPVAYEDTAHGVSVYRVSGAAE